jgi:signal transduction histidine kinase
MIAAPSRLSDVLSAVVSELRSLAAALNVRVLESYEPATVMGDPDEMAQVFSGLLTNALRQSAAHSVVVSTRVTGESAVTSITHEGQGFEASDAHSLLHLTLGSPPAGGTALGRAARLIGAGGGQIAAENRSNHTGGVVTVWLPLVRAQTPME